MSGIWKRTSSIIVTCIRPFRQRDLKEIDLRDSHIDAISSYPAAGRLELFPHEPDWIYWYKFKSVLVSEFRKRSILQDGGNFFIVYIKW